MKNNPDEFSDEEILRICSDISGKKLATELHTTRRKVHAQRVLMLNNPILYVKKSVLANQIPGLWLVNKLTAEKVIKNYDINTVKYWHYIAVNLLSNGMLEEPDTKFIQQIKFFNEKRLTEISVAEFCQLKNISYTAKCVLEGTKNRKEKLVLSFDEFFVSS